MNQFLKRAITSCAAGFALVLSFTAKVNAEEIEAVPSDNIAASIVPPAQDSQSAQSGQGTEASTGNSEVQSETPGTDVTVQEVSGTVNAAVTADSQSEAGSDAESDAAENMQSDISSATDVQNEKPESDNQQSDMQAAEQDLSGETASLSADPTLSGQSSDTEESNGIALPEPVVSASVSVGDTTLGEGSVDSGWNSQSSKGWRYNGQCISMVNNDTAVDIHAEGQGIELSAAGFNRIGTLYADGDVNITGTGILLIDAIDMLEGTKLNLLTDTARHENGSAAVFLRQEDGTYLLINGSSVTGVLDEDYTLPDGITLVIPEGSKLDMRVSHTVTKRTVRNDLLTGSSSETEEVFLDRETLQNVDYNETEPGGAESAQENERIIRYTDIAFSVPQMTVPAGSVLRINQGGLLNMQAYSYRSSFTDYSLNMSILQILGTLELDGSITADDSIGGFRLARIDLGEDAVVSGSGTITDAVVYVKTNKPVSVNLAGKSAAAIYSGAGEKLDINALSPDVVVTFNNNAKLNRAVGSAGSRVTFYGVDIENQLVILDECACDYRIGSGYIYHSGNLLNEAFPDAQRKTAQRTDDNQYQIEVQSLASGKEIVFGSDNYNSKIPGFAYCSNADLLSGKGIAWQSEMGTLPNEICWSDLFSPYENGYLDIFYCDPTTGKITAVQLYYDDQPVDITGAFLIRKVMASLQTNAGGGESLTSTNTGNTGSGVLGGQNAGTLQGGKPLSILSGSRSNTPPQNSTGEDTGNTSGENTGNGNTGSDTDTGNTGDNTSTENTGSTDTENTVPGGTEGGSTGDEDSENGNTNGEGGDIGNPGDENVPDDADSQPETSDMDADDTADTAGESRNLIISVTGKDGQFTVTAEYDHMALKNLGGGSVSVSFRWVIPAQWSKSDLFAVFPKPDGTLAAFRITCAPDGSLCFDTTMLGDFTIVCFPWSGECFTDEFYSALRRSL